VLVVIFYTKYKHEAWQLTIKQPCWHMTSRRPQPLHAICPIMCSEAVGPMSGKRGRERNFTAKQQFGYKFRAQDGIFHYFLFSAVGSLQYTFCPTISGYHFYNAIFSDFQPSN
jgi:hypothetical protein